MEFFQKPSVFKGLRFDMYNKQDVLFSLKIVEKNTIA